MKEKEILFFSCFFFVFYSWNIVFLLFLFSPGRIVTCSSALFSSVLKTTVNLKEEEEKKNCLYNPTSCYLIFFYFILLLNIFLKKNIIRKYRSFFSIPYTRTSLQEPMRFESFMLINWMKINVHYARLKSKQRIPI